METIEQVTARIAELDRTARGRKFTDAEREEWHSLNARVDENENEIRRARIRELGSRAGNVERAAPFGADPGPRPAALRRPLRGAGDGRAPDPARHADRSRGRFGSWSADDDNICRGSSSAWRCSRLRSP